MRSTDPSDRNPVLADVARPGLCRLRRTNIAAGPGRCTTDDLQVLLQAGLHHGLTVRSAQQISVTRERACRLIKIKNTQSIVRNNRVCAASSRTPALPTGCLDEFEEVHIASRHDNG